PLWARSFDRGVDFVSAAPDGGWLLAASPSSGLGSDALLHTDAFGANARPLGVVTHVRVTSLRLLPNDEVVIGSDWSDFARFGDHYLEGPAEVLLSAVGRLAPAD
ncbi:MAG TPA: hypothetical protein VL400_14820, partial [Polyangiaceae bacterium]|nr:hypothetical protein [Polyangiaceae bacterium]